MWVVPGVVDSDVPVPAHHLSTPTQLYSARNDAIRRVVAECQSRGGNAVIALHFDAGDMAGFAQVCAYGTACVVEKLDPDLPDYPQLVRRA